MFCQSWGTIHCKNQITWLKDWYQLYVITMQKKEVFATDLAILSNSKIYVKLIQDVIHSIC